jgi:hypothetical protein
MWLLLGNGRIALGACSETMLKEKTVQIDQRAQSDPRRAKMHTRAGCGVQHPGRKNDDDAWFYLDVNDLARCSLFTVLPPKSPPKERMPTIVDFNFLPDMGRMTA